MIVHGIEIVATDTLIKARLAKIEVAVVTDATMPVRSSNRCIAFVAADAEGLTRCAWKPGEG